MSVKSYPYIFIHGMLGYGEDEMINDYIPYWGMLSCDVLKIMRSEGLEAHAPSISSLGSAWDRACEIYAQLTGGRVDYGKVHSQRYGHERYGRTYPKPLVNNWGGYDEYGNLNKIHLIGHSFGGATVRVFAHILAVGSEEERRGTPTCELSPFFEGGKGEWMQSVTTIASPHDGTSVIEAIGALLPVLKMMTFGLAHLMDNTRANKIYDLGLDQWGATSDPHDIPRITRIVQPKRFFDLLTTKDSLYYDLSLAGAREINEYCECSASPYYFSIASDNSVKMKNGNYRMKVNSFLPFWVTGWLIGKNKFDKTVMEKLDESWLKSDGCSNTVSALHPSDEPFIFYNGVPSSIRRGVWNVMPVYEGDHLDIIGGSLRGFLDRSHTAKYYMGLINMLEKLDL